MKENYKAWNINIDDFYKITDEREKLKFLLSFAVLAPSSHNSQPWKFKISNNKIEVFFDKERRLIHGDKNDRQAYISIGCALENILIAADFFGLESKVSYIESGRIVDVIFSQTGKKKSDNTHLIYYTPNRCTNRGKFKNKSPIPISFLEEIKNLSNEKLNISVITENEKSKKDLVTNIVNNAQIESMDSNIFREELSHYLKSNFTKEKIGMPGFTLGIPGPISLFLPFLIKKNNMSRVSKKQDEALLKNYTSTFVIISSLQDNYENWINAGQALEHVWLMAERLGLSCAPLAAAIETGEHYKKLQDLLKINMRPQVFFRMGYPEKRVRHSPRLSVKDVLVS